MLCNIKFIRIVRSLAVADKFAVYIKVNARRNPEKCYDIHLVCAFDVNFLAINPA